jgi:signal peptidase I
MNLSNHPIASPDRPLVSPDAALDPPEVSVVSPQVSTVPSRPRVVTTLGADMIGSLQSLLGTVIIAIFVITFVVQAFQIPSESMENTLLVGDYLLVNKLCYGGHGLGDHLMPYQKIVRGDIIVFHYPVDPTQHFVKRVIGVPGDRLRMINKKVFIKGKPLDEPYVRFLEPPVNMFRDNFPRTDIPAFGLEGKWWLEMRKLVQDGELIIPEGQYFVLGDNRDDSQDSRYWGFVPRENIIGRPLVIFWSLDVPEDNGEPKSMAERMAAFVHITTHFFGITRWNRLFRLVR